MRLLFALLVLVPVLCWGQMPAGGSGSGGSKGNPAKWSHVCGANQVLKDDGTGTWTCSSPLETTGDVEATTLFTGPEQVLGTVNGSTAVARPMPVFRNDFDATYDRLCWVDANGQLEPCDSAGNVKPPDFSASITGCWLVDEAESGSTIPDECAGDGDHDATARGPLGFVYGTTGGPTGMQADGRVADATVQNNDRLEVEQNKSTLIGPSWLYHLSFNPGAFTAATSGTTLLRFGASSDNWVRIRYEMTSGDIEVRTDDGTSETTTPCATVAPTASTWTHITFICEATAAATGPLYCFQDGTLVNTIADGCRSMGTPAAINDFTIGGITGGWGLDSAEPGDTSTFARNVAWDVCDTPGDCRTEWTNSNVCSLANTGINGQDSHGLGC